MFASKITKEEINNLETRHFTGDIHLIDTRSKFRDACREIAEQPLLGFDTESKPSFRKGPVHDISLIQFANATDAWLIRLNKIGLPDELKSILERKDLLKIGAGLNDDFNRIRNLDSIEPDGFLDLQKFVEKFEIESKSLKKLTAIILGFKISKSQQLSNWEAEEFTEAQKLYAATDAWVCYEMYRVLSKRG